MSEEQIDRIQERRARIKDLLNDLGESLRLVRDLQQSFEVNLRYKPRRLSANPPLCMALSIIPPAWEASAIAVHVSTIFLRSVVKGNVYTSTA